MKSLVNYIEQFVSLNEEALSTLNNLVTQKKYKKGAHILSAGQRCDHIWFLKKGMVRKYFLHEGLEVTSWIHTENQFFTSIQSYANQQAADEFIQASENVELIGISRDNSKKLSAFPQFIQFSNELMEREFVNIEKHSRALSQKDARGKYNYLFEIAPEVIKRAKLIHIASILHLSPETISRVRKLK